MKVFSCWHSTSLMVILFFCCAMVKHGTSIWPASVHPSVCLSYKAEDIITHFPHPGSRIILVS